MKKIIGAILLTAMVNACAGYFDRDSASGNKAQELAVTGGGYLSRAGSSQISPYLYRDKELNATLFYASDEEGSLDIYYASMNSSGVFSPPKKLTNAINTQNWEEYFPLVFHAQNPSWLDSTFMTLFSVVEGTLSLETYEITNVNGTVHVLNQLQSLSLPFNPTAITVEKESVSNVSQLYIFDGSTNYYTASWDNYTGWGSLFNTNTLPGNPAIHSGSIYTYSGFSWGYTVGVFSTLGAESNKQLYVWADGSAEVPSWSEVFYEHPVVYNSDYDDLHPHIDFFAPEGVGKVYFSSARQDAYPDLYRYNVDTLSTIVPFYDLDTFLGVN